MIEEFKKYNWGGYKNQVLCCAYQYLFSNFLPSIICLLILSLMFFFQSFFTFHLVYMKFFLFGYIFTLFYFLFVGADAFVSDDFSEYTSKDLNDWDKLKSFLFVGESAFVFDDFSEYTFKDLNDWDKLKSFLFVGEGAFMSNDFSEYTSKDLKDWDKPKSCFGLGGI